MKRSFGWFALILLFGCQDDGSRDSGIDSGINGPYEGAGDVTEHAVSTNDVESRGSVRTVVSYAGDSTLLPDDSVVYVFVRVPGTTMPVAVEKFSPKQLPLEVSFDHPKAGIDSVEVIARLSLTGSVRLNPGDPQIVSAPVGFSIAPEPLDLSIPGDVTTSFFPSNDEVFVDVLVTLASEVSAPAETPVFVAAREPSGLPVAVKRLSVADLPATVRLSDAQSMFQTNKLSQHEEISIVARVALSGQPVARIGDWEGVVESFNRTRLDGPVSILISSQIK